MRGFRSVAMLTTILVLSGLVATAPAGASEDERAHAPNQALVGAHSGEHGRAEEAIRAHGGRVVSYYEPGNFFIVETPSRAPDWVQEMRSDDAVRYAELDYELSVGATPNDPRYSELYGMQKIQAPTAWDTTTGSSSIVVGVIDTGVDYNHEDLAANMWVNAGETPGNGIDDDGNGWRDDVHGADCINNDGDPMDDHGHGTHVSGTIGAVGNNLTGVVGVNWDVGIMALKFLGANGSGSTSNAIECLDYAIANGAHLTNNSWGGGGFSTALRDAITRAQLDNQLFVAAAGNSGTNNDTSPHFPSSYPQDNVIAVAATDVDDNLASFSNFGEASVDLAAPGVAILSTTRNNSYASSSGTSMATPHVTGAAALLLANSPGALYQTIRDQIFNNVDKLDNLNSKVATGGRLNVGKAMAPATLAISNLTVSPDPFSPNGDTIAETTTISFALNKAATWTIQVDGALFSGSTAGPGTVTQVWDGTNGIGGPVVADGTYPVAVNAAAGLESASASDSVTVDTTGPVISGLAATNITHVAADIVWTTNEASDSRVDYGTTSGSYTNSASNGSPVTSHKLTLTGLSPATTYYYQVTSTDGVGNETASSEQSFTTLAGPPPLTVTVAKVSQAKQGKNLLSGLQVTVTDPGGAPVAGASVTLRVGSGACPVNTAISTLTGTTNAAGQVTLTFKTKNPGNYCASATATKTGYTQGTGSTPFTVT